MKKYDENFMDAKTKIENIILNFMAKNFSHYSASVCRM